MALTPKQERFCREIASGKDYTNAYLTAYDWNGSTAGAQQESLKLANKPEVQERIQTLLKPLQYIAQRDGITERQKQLEYIQSRIAICEEREDEQSIIRYTDMLNKIYSLYKESETTEQRESSIANLSTEALQKVLKSS